MSAESKAFSKGTSPSWVNWLIVTLVLGIVTFLASPNAPLGGFWGVQGERAMPSGPQRLLFILLSVIQSLSFGLGIAFLLFGFSQASARTTANPGLARVTQLAIAWSLISWWPHSSFHQTLSAENISGLLAVEYAFHATLILPGLIVMYFFVKILQPDKMLSHRS